MYVFSSIALHCVFLRQGLSIAWSSQIQLAWPETPRDPPDSTSLVLEQQGHSWVLRWCWELSSSPHAVFVLCFVLLLLFETGFLCG